MDMALSPAQCRAARGWLDISQAELARRAGVGLSTVRDFEAGRTVPIRRSLDAMCRALTEAGVALTFSAEGYPLGIQAVGNVPAVENAADSQRAYEIRVEAGSR